MIPERPWESVGADIVSINKKYYLCIVDYHSKFPIINQVEGFSAVNLIKHARFFSECDLPRKIVLDTGTNFDMRNAKISACALTYIMQTSEQWASRCIHNIHQKNNEKIL